MGCVREKRMFPQIYYSLQVTYGDVVVKHPLVVVYILLLENFKRPGRVTNSIISSLFGPWIGVKLKYIIYKRRDGVELIYILSFFLLLD